MGGAPGIMPPRPPYAAPGPGDRSPRARPNYSKLGEYSDRRCKEIRLTNRRSDQIRHRPPRTAYPAHAVTARVQAFRGKAIQGWY
jgi:classical protein kinase C